VKPLQPGKTVVVVDDEDALCEILRVVFEHEGYSVAVARNGVEALATLRSMPVKPCLVILDLLMPVLDGNAVYREMKKDPALAGVNVVVTTSEPARAPSGVFIMKKPVALELMLDTVRKCC